MTPWPKKGSARVELGNETAVWERYATELALVFGDTRARVRAVSAAYFVNGFDIDMICDLSGFPAWRIRQAILSTPARRFG
jgi:hypothetical protein